MTTRVKTADEHENTVFFWDKQKRTISKLLDGRIWYWELGEDFDFRCVGSKPNQKTKAEPKRKI